MKEQLMNEENHGKGIVNLNIEINATDQLIWKLILNQQDIPIWVPMRRMKIFLQKFDNSFVDFPDFVDS